MSLEKILALSLLCLFSITANCSHKENQFELSGGMIKINLPRKDSNTGILNSGRSLPHLSKQFDTEEQINKISMPTYSKTVDLKETTVCEHLGIHHTYKFGRFGLTNDSLDLLPNDTVLEIAVNKDGKIKIMKGLAAIDKIKTCTNLGKTVGVDQHVLTTLNEFSEYYKMDSQFVNFSKQLPGYTRLFKSNIFDPNKVYLEKLLNIFDQFQLSPQTKFTSVSKTLSSLSSMQLKELVNSNTRSISVNITKHHNINDQLESSQTKDMREFTLRALQHSQRCKIFVEVIKSLMNDTSLFNSVLPIIHMQNPELNQHDNFMIRSSKKEMFTALKKIYRQSNVQDAFKSIVSKNAFRWTIVIVLNVKDDVIDDEYFIDLVDQLHTMIFERLVNGGVMIIDSDGHRCISAEKTALLKANTNVNHASQLVDFEKTKIPKLVALICDQFSHLPVLIEVKPSQP